MGLYCPVCCHLSGDKIFVIGHQSFQTDTICWTQSFFRAKSRKKALELYNELAAKRTKYPYCWNQVGLSSVRELKTEN